MILFRCGNCGAPQVTDEEYIDQTFQCDNCMGAFTVPAESDPEMALIFHAGESETGVPMLEEDVRRMLAKGKLVSTDLMWYNEAWYPLGQLYGETSLNNINPVPDGFEPEPPLEDLVGELRPIRDLSLVIEEKKVIMKKRRDRKTKIAKFKLFSFAAAIVALLVMAYVLFLGEMVFKSMKMPVQIVVHNAGNTKYFITDPWQDSEIALSHNQKKSLEGYVGFPKSVKIKYRSGNKEETVKVPVAPGKTSWVNLAGKARYKVFKPDVVIMESITGTDALAAQIRDNKNPEAVKNLDKQFAEIVKKFYAGEAKGEVLPWKKYDFPEAPEITITDEYDENGKKIEEEKDDSENEEEKESAVRPVILTKTKFRANIQNGYIEEDISKKDEYKGGVTFRVGLVKMSKDRSVNVGEVTLNYRRTKDKHYVDFTTWGTASIKGVTYTGNWKYIANCSINKTNWWWRWEFSGAPESNPKGKKIYLKVEKNGKEKISGTVASASPVRTSSSSSSSKSTSSSSSSKSSTGSSGSYTSKDIGDTGLTGSTFGGNGKYTIKGSGANIWSTEDTFRFAYKKIDGDFVIQCKLTSLVKTHDWCKAGLMVRENLQSKARNYALVLAPSGMLSLQKRDSYGAQTSNKMQTNNKKAPIYLRIKRAGNTFTTYYSNDGWKWEEHKKDTLTLPKKVYVGMCVTSHQHGKLTTAVFESVKNNGKEW